MFDENTIITVVPMESVSLLACVYIHLNIYIDTDSIGTIITGVKSSFKIPKKHYQY